MDRSYDEKSLQPGLFTFYMNNQTENDQQSQLNELNLHQVNNLQSKDNGRKCTKAKNNKNLHITNKQNQRQLQERQQKLCKFLSHCVGAGKRYKNHIEAQAQNNRDFDMNNQNINYQYSELPDQQEDRKRQVSPQNQKDKSKQRLSLPGSTIKKQRQNNKYAQSSADQNDEYRKNMKVSQLTNDDLTYKIETKRSKVHSKSHSQMHKSSSRSKEREDRAKQDSISNKPKLNLNINKMQIFRNQTNNDKLNIQTKSFGIHSDSRETKNDIDGQKTELQYPRLIKHHSQLLSLYRRQPSSINVIVLPTKINRNVKIESTCTAQEWQNRQSNNIKNLKPNQLKILENINRYFVSEKQPCHLPSIKPIKQSHSKPINLNNQKQTALIKITPGLCGQCRSSNDCCQKNDSSHYTSQTHKIFMNDVSSHTTNFHQKRSNRLQLLFRPKKQGIPVKSANNVQQLAEIAQIQQQRKINQIYYSQDHRQKKPLTINFSIESKERIFDGFDQRKRILLEKINQLDKKDKKLNMKKQSKPVSKNKQNRLEIKPKIKSN